MPEPPLGGGVGEPTYGPQASVVSWKYVALRFDQKAMIGRPDGAADTRRYQA